MAVYDDTLQRKLDQLWYRLPANTLDALKGERQAMLIREFQIAARRKFGARDATGGTSIVAANLKQADLTTYPNAKLPDDFQPTGLADDATLKAIDAWLAAPAHLRAPVIFQTRFAGSAKHPWDRIDQEGFIFHDEAISPKPRIFVSDFTGRYPLDGDIPPRIPVGTSTRWYDRKIDAILIGTACTAKQSYQAPFDPKLLTGSDWPALTETQRATFRVLAAVASVESEGVLDGINAYDNAVFSAGPYNYTAFENRTVGDGELGAFFSYLAFVSPADSGPLFASFGLGPTKVWGAGLFVTDQRVYRSGIGFASAGGALTAPETVTERDWMRVWPLVYRIEDAFRSSRSLQRAIWPFARQRIIDLLTTPWGVNAGPPGATTLGDVFRSEASVALLLRWHVNRPGQVVTGGISGRVPTGLLKTAGLDKLDISRWTAAEEAKLVAAFAQAVDKGGKLRAASTADLRKTLAAVAAWSRPDWANGDRGPSLSRAPGFTPYMDGVPFPRGSR